MAKTSCSDAGESCNRSTGNLTVTVRDAKTSVAIPEFKFIVNADNVGDPQVDIPEYARDPSKFPSLKPGASHSPVVATGEATGTTTPAVTLTEGNYMISVLAPGYKMGANWVSITAGSDVTVEVVLHPHPLPLSKIRVHVFHVINKRYGATDGWVSMPDGPTWTTHIPSTGTVFPTRFPCGTGCRKHPFRYR